jgi:hypothetical protein
MIDVSHFANGRLSLVVNMNGAFVVSRLVSSRDAIE